MRCSGKFEIMDRMLPKLQRTKHKVLVFTQMTRVLDIMEDYMDLRRYPYLRLDGQTKPETRSKFLELFNAENSPYFVFLLSTRAGGLGLNLQTADTVVIFDSDWNPQMDLQAQDRAHRIGQQAEVRVFRLVTCSPVEEQILQRAQYKLGLDHAVIQSGKFNKKSSTITERKEMLTTVLREGVDMGQEVDAADDESLNRMLARSEDELDLFRQMDAESERDLREAWEKAGNAGNPPPRLMRDMSEVPVYLREPAPLPVNVEDLPAEDFGRGRRKRGDAVVYTDVFSEKQFCQLVEEGEDIEAAARKKVQRRAKRAAEQAEASSRDGNVDDAEEEDESASTKPKKRGRKGGKKSKEKSKRGRKAGRKSKSVKLAEAEVGAKNVRKHLGGIIDALYDAQDEDGRSCSERFDDIGTWCMDLSRLRANVKSSVYGDGDAFIRDFRAMSNDVISKHASSDVYMHHLELMNDIVRREYRSRFDSEPNLGKVLPLKLNVSSMASAASVAGSSEVASTNAGAASDSDSSSSSDIDIGDDDEGDGWSVSEAGDDRPSKRARVLP